MNKLPIPLLLSYLITQSAWAFEESKKPRLSFDGFFAATVQVIFIRKSKEACMDLDPEKSDEFEEIFSQWEDKNKDEILAIQSLQLEIDMKFKQLASGESRISSSEKEKIIAKDYFESRDKIMFSAKIFHRSLPNHVKKELCENARKVITNDPLHGLLEQTFSFQSEIFNRISADTLPGY